MSIRQLLLATLACGAAAGLPVAASAQAAAGPGTPAVPVAGAVPATPLTLTQALQAARDNIDVSIARRALAAARADITSANHAPNPVLTGKFSSIDLQNGVGGGNVLTQKRIDKSIGVDWTWERGNKRVLRTQVAERSAAAAQADVDDTQVQQQLAAHAAYFDLLAAQERVQEITLIERSSAQLAGSAARRVRAGDLAAQDAARTEIEAQRAASDVQTADLDRQRAALALAELLGMAGTTGLQAQPEWPVLDAQDAVVPADVSALVESRADVRGALQRLQAAQAAVDVASAQKKADVTLGSSFDHYPGTSTRLLELRLQMPLQGVFGTYDYQGEVARALAQRDQAQDALDKVRRSATIEVQRLRQEILNTADRARRYAAEILPRARKVAESAELAYGKGALSLTDLIEARRTLRATLLDDLAARTDYAKAAGAWQLRTQVEPLLSK